MDAKALREHLEQLHAELGGSGPVDTETRALLGDIMRDIARLTEAPGNAPATEPSPAERLEGIAVRFEAGHPAVSASIPWYNWRVRLALDAARQANYL